MGRNRTVALLDIVTDSFEGINQERNVEVPCACRRKDTEHTGDVPRALQRPEAELSSCRSRARGTQITWGWLLAPCYYSTESWKGWVLLWVIYHDNMRNLGAKEDCCKFFKKKFYRISAIYYM